MYVYYKNNASNRHIFCNSDTFLAKHYSTASKNTQVADKEKQVAARRFVLYAVYNIEKQIIFIIY